MTEGSKSSCQQLTCISRRAGERLSFGSLALRLDLVLKQAEKAGGKEVGKIVNRQEKWDTFAECVISNEMAYCVILLTFLI